MSPFENRFTQFLATGEYVAAEDARPKGWNSNPDFEEKHPRGNFANKGQFRKSEKTLAKLDEADAAAAKKAKDGDISAPLGDPERGRQAIIDGPGAGYLATLEREVEAGKTEGLEKEKERCRHYIENGKDDAEKQLHRDALAFLEELGKKAEKKNIPENKIPSDAEIEEAAKATSKAFDFSEQAVKNKISDMLKGTRVFNDQNGGLLDVVQAMKGKGGVVQSIKARAKEQFIREDHPWFDENYWEVKNTPASKAYEPPFDMHKEGLYGYGKTDPSAKDAATLAATFNQRAGWGFSDDEVQAYFDAFKDMDAGKVPKLPDLDGKTYEPPMDTKWNGPQQALAAIFQKRPDLIRPYIVERLEDANFHSEVKELRSGDYKKRTKPYNSQKEYEERQRRQMAQDAAAVKYLKEC